MKLNVNWTRVKKMYVVFNKRFYHKILNHKSNTCQKKYTIV